MDTAQNAFSSRCIDLSFVSLSTAGQFASVFNECRPSSQSAYCSVPWQVSPEQACCGICPSPAINAYGTLIGLAIASFFNLLIVLFRPASSAIYSKSCFLPAPPPLPPFFGIPTLTLRWHLTVCGQLMLGNMFVVAVAVRNSMGTLSEGTNAIQKWHAEQVSRVFSRPPHRQLTSMLEPFRRFAFLLASSSCALIVACVLSDVHFIHVSSGAPS